MITPDGNHTGDTLEEVVQHLDNVISCWKELIQQVQAAYKEMGHTSAGHILLSARLILAKHTHVDKWPEGD